MEDEFEGADRELITEWLNTASLSTETAERLEILHKLKEFLIKKMPSLLPEFLPDILHFTMDPNVEMKKVLVGFIEEACKINESLLVKVIVTLHMLLCGDNIAVQKRVIQATIMIYRRMLAWLVKASVTTPEMEHTWNLLTQMKAEIINFIDSENDGIRTSAVKFLECVVLLQTYPDPMEKHPNDFSLDDVPLTLKVARRRKLEEEAHKIFDILIKFNGSQHISSANVFASSGALTNIAKHRPEFMGRVVHSIELLHSNLPPTLSSTQVNSVRKKLKFELILLIKHYAAFDYLENISSMLLELGCTQQEVQKLTPKLDERRRYSKRLIQDDLQPLSKKARYDVDHSAEEQQQKHATDENEIYVLSHLNIDIVVQLVLSTLTKLPNVMPNQFKIDYAAFLKMGRVGDLKVLGKMLAIQLLEADLGPGAILLKELSVVKDKVVEEEVASKKQDVEKDDGDKAKKDRVKVPRIKTLKLNEITKPIEKDTKEILLLGSVQRILMSDKVGCTQLRQKIVVTMAASFSEVVRTSILAFLLKDLRGNIEIALSWLYEEYSIMQGFTRLPALRREGRLDQGYNMLLKSFITAAATDSFVLTRLLLETPLVSEQALDLLRVICRNEQRCTWALGLLKDLILLRPPKQTLFLSALLTQTTYDNPVIQECAIKHVVDLYTRQALKSSIEKFVALHMDFVRLFRPPLSLFGELQGRPSSGDDWNDELVKVCLAPYVALLPINHELIHELAKVYVQTNADIKRIILRLVEAPIRTMGMESQELLKLVEQCPKGSETLITRIIHILTDKGQPSSQLVQIVRDLYQTRVSDVRFLIPVLNGLNKSEIVAALPKLIKLNPVVVREVFNRLLGLHGESPMTPTELLVALHLVEGDLKTTMKATSMCLNEKQIFSQEVLAVVLQQLMDQTPLPTLLMRTVIQALGSYPRLSGFVMNILQRLILKQVWKQKVVWDGFIKCCQRTKPQSFSVLMQLPSKQLTEALTMCPELREPLKQYLATFSDGQRTHIPSSVQEMIMGNVHEPVRKPSEILPVPTPTSLSGLPHPQIVTEPLPPGME